MLKKTAKAFQWNPTVSPSLQNQNYMFMAIRDYSGKRSLNENLKTSHRMVIHNKSPILLNILNVFFQSNEKKNISNVPFWALTHTEFVFWNNVCLLVVRRNSYSEGFRLFPWNEFYIRKFVFI